MWHMLQIQMVLTLLCHHYISGIIISHHDCCKIHLESYLPSFELLNQSVLILGSEPLKLDKLLLSNTVTPLNKGLVFKVKHVCPAVWCFTVTWIHRIQEVTSGK